ncbi:MAG: UDP-N-acetylglucosamine 2-epimerase, partial [Fimbriimonadaceae bacterium]|nr:UDP-N-acetylglucosamine 2-epimerase [Fimbriimonadaceae bacterium]
MSSRRTIGVVTVGRSDYGIYRPLLEALDEAADLEAQLLVSGMHLSEEHGLTVRQIEADGRPIAGRIEMSADGDSPQAIAESMGRGMIGFGRLFAEWRPDILMVLGDRYETFAAAAASLPFNIPIAHLHGGEATFGAFDEAFRHSISKMAHIHFPSTELYGRRLVQLGEAPWRVHPTGALAVDNILRLPILGREELESRFGLDLSEPPLLVTHHPETLSPETVQADCDALMSALRESGLP